jgi:hypothetical protein
VKEARVRYLLLIGGAEGADERDDEEICGSPDALAWVRDLERRGRYLGGDLLEPADAARTVRVRGDEVLLSDGPYAETKDQVGGYCVLECASLTEAVAAAAAHPVARFGLIEVRPIKEGS